MTEFLYTADALPVLQNRVYPDAASALNCPTGDLALLACPRTGIVVNAKFEPGKVIYDAAYHNEQAISGAFQDHLRQVADLVQRHVNCTAIVEIGCGKGAFLDVLAGRGIAAVGFDPAYEGANPLICKELFSARAQIRGSGVILRHVLEHIENPVDFLRVIRDANGGGGRVYVEVPCLDWIIANRAWFDVFYEHANYFRMSDFERMFGVVVHAERTFGGQYLSVVAELDSLRDPGPSDAPTWPSDFGHGLARRADPKQPASTQLVWGAASKGVIFSLMMQRAGHPIAAAVDINPAKQGRYLPCTGTEVFAPDRAMAQFPRGTRAWVMNPNYMSEVDRLAGHHFELRPIDP